MQHGDLAMVQELTFAAQKNGAVGALFPSLDSSIK
jgi:hypothetical protein